MPYKALFSRCTPKERLSATRGLCCSTGYESMRTTTLGAQAVDLDLNEKIIAHQCNPELTFFVEDMLHHYAYVRPVDAIVCIAGLVYLLAEQLQPSVGETDTER